MEQAEKEIEEALRLNHPAHRHGGLATTRADLEDPLGTTVVSSRDSEYTLAELEKNAINGESLAVPVSHGTLDADRRSVSGVSVKDAEKEFAELQRELSHFSRISRQHSKRDGNDQTVDVEKAISASTTEDAEQFDLEETLRGNKQMEDEAGIKGKQIGVMWEDLTVKGIGGSKIHVPTFPDAFVDFFGGPVKLAINLLGLGRKAEEVEILRNFKGLAKPGEMVLVLGRPGSGCTSFLKVIANQRFGYTGVEGEVLYGPFSSKEFGKRYRGEAVYCQEDDVHHPTLTVGQTLGFALETKVPGARPGGITVRQFRDKVVDMMLRMFNIEHTRNTVVGNQFVRGISGGERKRVSGSAASSDVCIEVLTAHTTGLHRRDDDCRRSGLFPRQQHSWPGCINRCRLCEIPPDHHQHLQDDNICFAIPSI
jgi:ATP-binding cassette, subfamily G (WHITE), member 2, SNQ2